MVARGKPPDPGHVRDPDLIWGNSHTVIMGGRLKLTLEGQHSTQVPNAGKLHVIRRSVESANRQPDRLVCSHSQGYADLKSLIRQRRGPQIRKES